MKTLQSLTKKVDTLIYKLHMGLGAVALAVLTLMLITLSAVEAKAAGVAVADQMNLNPQSKEEYAELYYRFVQDCKENHAMFNMSGRPANQIMDAEIMDFNNDGRYELLLYAAAEAPDGKMNATTNVLPLSYVLDYYRPYEENGQVETDNRIYWIGGFSSENTDVYVTEYNGIPALVVNSPALKERKLRYIAENGVFTEMVVKASSEPAQYDKTGKAVSAWGVKANDRLRIDPGTEPDFSPKVTSGERILEYMNK